MARYELDGNGLDASGNGRHGAVNGTLPATDRFGSLGAATRLGGGTDGIEVPADSGLSDKTMTRLPLVAWVRTTASATSQRLIAKGAPNQYNYSLFLFNGHAAVTAWQSAGADHLLVEGTSRVIDGRWHLVVGTIVNGVVARIYVDGVPEGTDNTPVGAWHRGGPGALQLGRHPDYTNAFYTPESLVGDLAAVRIMRRALSDVESAAVYVPGTLPDLVPSISPGTVKAAGEGRNTPGATFLMMRRRLATTL